MEEQLSKLRGHFNGTQASIANLLAAIESTLELHLEPTNYYQAITSTIRATTNDQIRNDSIYLLAIVIHYLPKPIIRIESNGILELIQINESTPTPVLKSILSILEPIYSNDPKLNISSSILPLIISQQAKLRRASQSLISKIININNKQLVISYTLQTLKSLSRQSKPEFALIISLLKFIQSILSHFDQQELIAHLLDPILIKHTQSNQFLNDAIFNTLEAITTNHNLESHQIVSIINHILQFNNQSITNPAQLNALEHAWISLARINPQLFSIELSTLKSLFENFSHPDQQTRSATQSLLSAICRYCLTDHEIINHNTKSSSTTTYGLLLQSILAGLGSTDILAMGGTPDLINVLKSLVNRLPRQHQHPSASNSIREHILVLDKLRATRTGLGPSIDDCLSTISQVCGPEFVLNILPLNLNLDSDPQPQQGRAWLLTTLKVFNSKLDHFIHHFVPLSESVFEKKRDTLKRLSAIKDDQTLKQNGLLQVKIYDTLIEQIWRLLPGYCDLPFDLETAFTRSFAELLTQVIYTQPTLRPTIFNSIKILIEKTLILSKRNSTGLDDKKNEFGFNATNHLNHLKTFAPNFLAVLFNVYNSSYDAENSTTNKGNSNRGYMVDCIRTLLDIISDNELNQSYSKIKSVLDQSVQTKSTITTLKMLDLLTVLLPRLISSCSSSSENKERIKELQTLICSDLFIKNSDSNLQKKSFKFITIYLDLISTKTGDGIHIIDDLDGLVNTIIGIDEKVKLTGPAKKERALLISSLITIIPTDKLHYIPRILTEVVLGCKESNVDVRELSYSVLVKIGNKMKVKGGKVDLKALVHGLDKLDDDDEDEEEEGEPMEEIDQDASIEEYFKMISAGLAAHSPHMISATIAALSRVLFEFHDELSRNTVDELVSTIEIFLNSPNREIAKTAIGFIKVLVISLDKAIVKEQLSKFIPGLLNWSNEHKNYFKSNISSIFERLLRKFGSDCLDSFCTSRNEDDGGRKLVNSLRKKHKKKAVNHKSDKNQNNPDQDDDQSGSDLERPTRQARLGDAYEEALYGGESSEDEDGDHQNKCSGNQKQQNKKTKKTERLDNQLMEDDEDQIMDLLDGGRMTNRVIAGKLAKAEKRKTELAKIGAGYKKDSLTGKMIIDDDEEDPVKLKAGNVNKNDSTNAFLEAIHGDDGFRRDARGNVKANKKRKQDQSNDNDNDDDDDDQIIQEAVQGFHIADPAAPNDQNSKKKKVKRVKEKLGSEFKAKKAGGDRVSKHKQDGGQEISPFAYLPLSSLNSKKKKSGVAKNLNITGKVRGSASRS
ncbi:hypothetical protein PSTG_14188 [Puccinia striiformis f. sp. tritici PST-78]|uniref:RRP12 HEAT domain-containing protein n=1 Tax=Puccinia striiformis f. sp. tritici PST-78 TaxID=1165861 RepID=A0A0L0UZP6_9BASI|nr:hypothetical protein PSTG_14188 [Puccinia striiformis f. sp. tritici PST-78]